MKPKTWARKLTWASYEATIVSARRKPWPSPSNMSSATGSPLARAASAISSAWFGGTTLSSSALQQQDRRGQLVDVVDGGAVDVDVAVLRVGPDQAVEVARLELVRVARQDLQVADAVRADAGGEDVGRGERAQGGVAAGAAALDHEPGAVGEALLDHRQRAVGAVVDVDDAPAALEPLAVGPAVAGAAAVVDVEHGVAAAWSRTAWPA